MTHLTNNLFTKIFLISSFLLIISVCILHKSMTSKPVHSHVKSSDINFLDNRFLPRLEFQYPLDKNTQPHSYPKDNHLSKKGLLLREILRNEQTRKKFEYVVEKAKELRLPAELALIPIIESRYNSKAVSNKGAGGVWQLMPKTGRFFGLRSKQRFDMKLSTRAALLYFKDLYKEFGNWELAIAAYNAGDGRVSKALRKNIHATTIRGLKLPKETRNYVLAFNQLKTEVKKYKAASDILSGTA